MKSYTKLAFLPLLIILFCLSNARAEGLKPFILAFQKTGDAETIVKETKKRLESGGFQIAGEYSPYPEAVVIAVTSREMKQTASRSKHGGFGASQRVAVTKVGDKIQISYTNPEYMFHAYRMKGSYKEVSQKLKNILGAEKPFGSKEYEPEDLREYHYKVFMPYFDDEDEIMEYDSHAEAVKAVEKALASRKGGCSKVYRIDIPGKEEVVFGVGLTIDGGADDFIMNEIDFKPIKSTAHLPYEMLVTGNRVVALNAKFRIAVNFPELSMMGDNSFMNIMDAPGAIQKALTLGAGGSEE